MIAGHRRFGLCLLVISMCAALPAAAQWISSGPNLYTTGQYVGIGTTSPGNPLVLSSGSLPFFQLDSTGTCGSCNPSFAFSLSGAYKAYVGTVSAANNAINGSVAGDMFIRAENNRILFSIDAGTTISGTMNSTGMTFKGTLAADNVIAKYQDVAEWVPAREPLDAGTVVILDAEHANGVMASNRAYDTRVAGVVSEQPGVLLGQKGVDKEKIATTGRVRVRVDASKRAISIGDILVTSPVEGTAMASVPVDVNGIQIHRPGTIIGKALEPLASGRGEIMVLLTLQ